MYKFILPLLMIVVGVSVVPAFADINFSDFSNGTQIDLSALYVSYNAPETITDQAPTVCGDVLCGHSTPQDRVPIFVHVGDLSDFKTLSTNYAFALIELPTGVTYTNIVLSGENATALKNNVGVFTACGSFAQGLCQPAQPTTAAVTNNYCPIAHTILLNQDGYLNYTFIKVNGTITKDYTHYVYPDYCLPETGQNPYSPIVVPNPIPIPAPIINSTNSTPIPSPPIPSPINNTNSTPINPITHKGYTWTDVEIVIVVILILSAIIGVIVSEKKQTKS